MVGDLLPALDIVTVLLAALISAVACAYWIPDVAPLSRIASDGWRAALGAAIVSPLVLCDRAFVAFASSGDSRALVRCHLVRFAIFAAVVAAIGYASQSLRQLPWSWLGLWLIASLVLTAAARWKLVSTLRRLEHEGSLTEAVAIVGSGPDADAWIEQLVQSRGKSIEIVGVFDDRAVRGKGCVYPPTGSIADLVELGKSQKLDWVVLTLPDSAKPRIQALVHRLMSISVRIGLSLSTAAGSGASSAGAGVAGGGTLLAVLVPRWISTLFELPWIALQRLAGGLRLVISRDGHATGEAMPFVIDDYDLESFTRVAAKHGEQSFSYVVTANADHLRRLHGDQRFRAAYAEADYTLLDSRFLALLLRVSRGLRLPVCAGSDLTARLLHRIIQPNDRVVLIGGSEAQAAQLCADHGLQGFKHFNPPMGFIKDPEAVQACLRFVEANSPFRFCLLAVGSPQQEFLASALKQRGQARGMALCIGASIDFLTGVETRAPKWMQRSGMEWMYRLIQSPRRMGPRYLWHGPRMFPLLRRTDVRLRQTARFTLDSHGGGEAAAETMPATGDRSLAGQ
ncbi:MAG TPA: WecB/TagA/CpsF family glycosyltransferase [Arenimonas sp.]|nr:WecB/TagA/CpsF family glycosyltransferase [Arenimonas sp.]